MPWCNPVVVGLASWLHDLAAVRGPKAQPEHPRLVRLAPQLLAPYRYDLTIVDQVSRAIASHSFPLQPGQLRQRRFASLRQTPSLRS